MNIVLAGEESSGLQMLAQLARSPHRLVAVLAAPCKQRLALPSVWNFAQKNGFATWPANWLRDPALADRFRTEQVDLFLNVHSLYIVHPAVLAAARIGAFNLHPGPLPRYAGLNAPSWAIYKGEKEHGVTVHKMDAGIDTGPIVYQAFFPITENDTALSVSMKASHKGIRLMLKLLKMAALGAEQIPMLLQDLSQRQYYGREVPHDGWLGWEREAVEIVNFVRACDYAPFRSPWGHLKVRLNGWQGEILKASRTGVLCPHVPPGTVGECEGTGVRVACLDEWISVRYLKIGEEYLKASQVLRSGDCFPTKSHDSSERQYCAC